MVTSMVPVQSPDLPSGSVITMKSIDCTNILIWYIISQRTPMHFYCICDLHEIFTNMLTCPAKSEHLSVDMYENDVYSVPCNDPLSSTASDNNCLGEWQWRNASYQYYRMNACGAVYINRVWVVWILCICTNHGSCVIKRILFLF